jgi:DNA-binding CsgD family transcriptional regulator
VLVLVAAPAIAAGLVGLDLIVDPGAPTGGELAVDLFEKSLMVAAMILVAFLVVRVTEVERDTRTMRADLLRARDEGAAWRAQSQQLMASLSEAIGAQFDAWGLTPAEADIAGLMLKGLPLREIAGLRSTSEATIRQQAQGVYRKSGLSNRAQLSAYFLEDLYDVASDPGKGGQSAEMLN